MKPRMGLVCFCVLSLSVSMTGTLRGQIEVQKLGLLKGVVSQESQRESFAQRLKAESSSSVHVEVVDFDFAKIQESWLVTSIERDGILIPAQFGQRVGDVINFGLKDPFNVGDLKSCPQACGSHDSVGQD